MIQSRPRPRLFLPRSANHPVAKHKSLFESSLHLAMALLFLAHQSIIKRDKVGIAFITSRVSQHITAQATEEMRA
jgi:hypothetical protein